MSRGSVNQFPVVQLCIFDRLWPILTFQDRLESIESLWIVDTVKEKQFRMLYVNIAKKVAIFNRAADF